MKSDRSLRWIGPGLALGMTSALAWIAYRGIPRTGFDPHYFLEYAKEFRHHLPRHPGTDWPYGYPLLGAAASRLGLSVFGGMLAVLAAALFAIYALLWPVLQGALGRAGPAAGALVCFAAAAILPIDFGGLLSEIAFAAFYLAMLSALAAWPARRAIAFAAMAAVLSFLMRYAGVLSLGVLVAWTLWVWTELRDERRRAAALIAVAGAICLCAALMLQNRHVTGFFAGPSRGYGAGFSELPLDAADFGWGALVSITTVGVRLRFAAAPAAYFAVGWMLLAAVLATAALRWFRPVSRWSRPFALGLAAYVVGMMVLRCIEGFDALYNGRYFLPALPLIVALACESLRRFPRACIAALAIGIAIPGIAVCVRGVSPEVAYDFTPVVAELKPQLGPDDTVGINVDAAGLSAWLDAPVARIDDADHAFQFRRNRFIVITGIAADRSASRYDWPPETLKIVAGLESGGGYRVIKRWPGCILLERTGVAR